MNDGFESKPSETWNGHGSSAYHYDRPLVIVSAFYKSMLRNIMQRFGPEFWVAWSRATYETLQFIIRQVRQGF